MKKIVSILVWDRVLTAAEITAQAAASLSGPGQSPRQRAHFGGIDQATMTVLEAGQRRSLLTASLAALLAGFAAIALIRRRRTRSALSDAKWRSLALKRRLVEVSARCYAYRDEGCHSPIKGSDVGMACPLLPGDLLFSVFSHLPLAARTRAACVSADWHSVAQIPSLYAAVDRALLGGKRRVARSVLLALAERHVSGATLELNLAGVRCVDDALVAAFAARAPSLTSVDLSACAVSDDSLFALAEHCPKLERLHLW